MNKETHHAAPATAQLQRIVVAMASCGRWAATARGRVQSMPRDNQHSTLVKYHFREHVDMASITSDMTEQEGAGRDPLLRARRPSTVVSAFINRRAPPPGAR